MQRRNSKDKRRDSKKRQQRGGNSATGVDNHMKEILGEYKLAVPQPSQSENAFGSRYDVGKLALTGGSRKDYKNRQRGGLAIDVTKIQALFTQDGKALADGLDIDTWLGNATNYGTTPEEQLQSLEMIRNGTEDGKTSGLPIQTSSVPAANIAWTLITNRPTFKIAYIKTKLPLLGEKTQARRNLIDSISGIAGIVGVTAGNYTTPNDVIMTGINTIITNLTTERNNANATVQTLTNERDTALAASANLAPVLAQLDDAYTNAVSTAATGGRRKSPKKQSPKKNTKSPKKQQRGGNYYLNVDAQKIGGLAEVTRVDQPLAPEASTFNKYPEPLYLKDLSNPTTVNGMANSVNVANAPTTGQTAGAKKEYMYVTNKRTGQPMKVRKSPKQMQMNNKNVQVRVLKQQGGVEGEQSVYTGDMMQRDFSGKQPDWSPKVI